MTNKQTLEEKKKREERKAYMIELHKSGMTYDEIGAIVGLSRQRVYQLIGGADKKLFRHIGADRCVYVGIRNWLNENKISINELTRRVYGCFHTENRNRLSSILRGYEAVTKCQIDKLLKATGLSYECAFERDRGSGIYDL